MAISYSLIWLPFALLITIASADQALIDSICSKTHNPTLCQQVFKSSVDAKREDLGQISSKVALQNTQVTSNLIKSFAMKPSEKDTCLELYDDTISYLNECKALFGKSEFRDANIKASAALDGVDTCSDEAPSAPPKLKEANQLNHDYISIILSVSNVGP